MPFVAVTPATRGAVVVDDDARFASLLDQLLRADAYGLDAEFHGNRSYYPRLAVLQLSTPDRVAVVDATTVDIRPLGAVLEGPGLMVAHAGEQDLQVLHRATGAIPARMLDTQVAAGFLGFGSPSLAKLARELLGRRMEKGPRMSDWFKRPLTPAQIEYAASDVAHLLELRSVIEKRLLAAGRLGWAADECERRRRVRPPDVERAWWRLKGSRQLRGRSRGVAQELAAWRERTAMSNDRPVRRVLSDEAILLLVERLPRSAGQMPASRLFDPRRLSPSTVDEILAAVGRGLTLPMDRLRLPERSDLPSPLQPLATLLAAWVAQQSQHLAIDASLIATRADIEAFLLGRPDNQMERGWRADLVGSTVGRIVAGKAAVAYDADEGLLLVDR